MSRFTHMSPERFEYLLSIVAEKLKKKTPLRKTIYPAERLLITLTYLAS